MLEWKLSEISGSWCRLEQGDLGAIAKLPQKGGVSVIVASRKNQRPAMNILRHKLKGLADLVIGLFLAIADVHNGE